MASATTDFATNSEETATGIQGTNLVVVHCIMYVT